MPSFNPQGTHRAFVKQEGDEWKPRPADLLVTIESYNIAQGIINCVDERARKISARISPASIARNEARKKAPASQAPRDIQWEGYLVDERMAKHLKIGHKVVLEKAVSKRAPIKQNNQTLYIYESERVLNVSDPSPAKTFEGLFTVSTFEGRVFQVQKWDEKAIDINDTTAIANIAGELDEINAAYIQKQFRPTVGVQFRVVRPSASPEEKYTVLDTSPPFDWVPRVRDENGVETSAGHPLDGAKFIEFVSGYSGYANDKFPQETNPGMFVELVRYVNYKASGMSRYMAIPEQQFDPLFILSHTQTRLAQDDSDFVQGKNYAVKGVLQLSADEPDPVTKTWKPRNIAVRLHANGPKGHVHAWVRSNDGHKTEPCQELKQVPVSKNGPGEKNSVTVPSVATPVATPPSQIPASIAAAPSVAAPADNQPAAPEAQTFGGDSGGFEDDWPAFNDNDDNPFGSDSGAGVSAAQASVAAAKNRMNGGS